MTPVSYSYQLPDTTRQQAGHWLLPLAWKTQ